MKWVALTFAVALSAQAGEPKYGFGHPATPEQIAGWDIDVRPDGAGLPSGHGSVEEGQAIYDVKCASCHGTFGEETSYMVLAGGVQPQDIESGRAATWTSGQPVRTVGTKLNSATTLFDYIRRAMPFAQPKSLKPNEVYALTAYVLNLNDILPSGTVLDEKSILQVKMPNRNGFTTAHGMMSVKGKPDVVGTACMKNCAKDVKITSEIPDFAKDSHGDLTEQVRSFAPTSPPRATATEVVSGPPGFELAKKSACLACHALDNPIVGPAFRAVAKKYKGDDKAAGRLQAKVKAGGVGVWGQVPMPPQPQVSEDDLKTILRWILSGAPSK